MDTWFAQLEDARRRQSFDIDNRTSNPKFQRVPEILLLTENKDKYFSPKIISFGPIHHKRPHLKKSEHYKLLWTSKFVEQYGSKINEDAKHACQLLFKEIQDNIEYIKNMFSTDIIEHYKEHFDKSDSGFAWMLFVDGCALLHFMENIDYHCPELLSLKFDQMMHMWRDAMLLENQLPSEMLEILCKERGINLHNCFSNYHIMGMFKPFGMEYANSKPIHLLDSFRWSYLLEVYGGGVHQSERQSDSREDVVNILIQLGHNQYKLNTYKSICDLKRAGIRLIPSKIDEGTRSNTSFTSKWFSGELRLPIFFFNDVTTYLFRNLVAYELCPDFHNNYECCSFFTFMDSLIDSAEDVKELCLAGVFENLLQSDQKLANLFNELGNDLPTKMSCITLPSNAVRYSKNYIQVSKQIEEHYRNKWKTWLAQAYNTHFSTPWAMIAFFAALLILVLTFLQTWFTIHSN